MTCRIHLTTLLLSTAALTVAAQRPDSLTGELRQTFRAVTAVRELPDGRALVLDSQERFVYLADFRTGNAQVIGQQGSADGQYLWPSRLLHRSADTALVWDAIEGRLHVVDWAGGEPNIRASIPRSAFGPYLQRPFNPIESDQQGHIYTEVQIGAGETLWYDGARLNCAWIRSFAFDARNRVGPRPVVTPAIIARKPLIQFASDGSLLIERVSLPALPSEYDVIDERAELKDRFELPPGTNIVATGRDAVYVTVRTAENPSRRFRLQRFTVRSPR